MELTVLTARRERVPAIEGRMGWEEKGVRKRNAARRAPRVVANDTTAGPNARGWLGRRRTAKLRARGEKEEEEMEERRERKASKAMFGGAIMK